MKVTPRVVLGTEGRHPREVNTSADETVMGRSPGHHRVSSVGDSHRQRVLLSMSGCGLGSSRSASNASFGFSVNSGTLCK